MPEGPKVNPWTQMWVAPRKAIRAVINFNPQYRFAVLSGFYGFPMLLHIAQSLSLGQVWPLALILVVALVLSVFIGMLGITIASGLLYWTGKWIGGKGSYQEIRTAVTWSNVTNIVNSLLWVILAISFGGTLFLNNFAQLTFVGAQLAAVSLIFLGQFILAVWGLVILFNTLSEVQNFSVWKAILNVVIPVVILIVAIWTLLWLIWAGMGMPSG